ncbi:hypothetical protein EDB87DRAFT_1648544 [Lactarius vividus]|nr:hypothetical protein EDB87DRAFT_1648544 [Lactarius vividus]
MSTNDVALDISSSAEGSSKHHKFTEETPEKYGHVVGITDNESFIVRALDVFLPFARNASAAELEHAYGRPKQEEDGLLGRDLQVIEDVKIHLWNEVNDPPIKREDPPQRDQDPRHMRSIDRYKTRDVGRRLVPIDDITAYQKRDSHMSLRFRKNGATEVTNRTASSNTKQSIREVRIPERNELRRLAHGSQLYREYRQQVGRKRTIVDMHRRQLQGKLRSIRRLKRFSPTISRRITPPAWLTLEHVNALDRLPDGFSTPISLLWGWTKTGSTRPLVLRIGTSADDSPAEAAGHTTIRYRGRQRLRQRRYGNLCSSRKHLPNYTNLEKQYRRVQRNRTRASRSLSPATAYSHTSRLAFWRCISYFENAKWRHKNIQKIGIAISDAEYRTPQYGASVLSRLDARNESAKQDDTGGPLEIASYLLNLLGDSRLTGSLHANNSLTPIDLVYENGDGTINWLLDPDLITPDNDNTLSDQNQQSYENTLRSVIARSDMSIDTSPTDPWARMMTCRFSNHTDRKNFVTNDSAHNADRLWSRVSMIPSWSQHRAPFPIIRTNPRLANSNLSIPSVPKLVMKLATEHSKRPSKPLPPPSSISVLKSRLVTAFEDSITSAIPSDLLRSLPPSDSARSNASALNLPLSLQKSWNLCIFSITDPTRSRAFPVQSPQSTRALRNDCVQPSLSPESLTPPHISSNVVPNKFLLEFSRTC